MTIPGERGKEAAMTSSDARAHTGPLAGPLAARAARQTAWAVAAAMLSLGLLLFLLPYASLALTAVLLGIALLATGGLRLVRGVTAGGQAGTHRGAHLLIGILAVLAGIYCLGDIAGTVVLLSLVVGLFWVMHGLVDLVAPGRPGPGRALTGITGGLSLLAGLIVIFWPAITVAVMVAVMGAWLACDGLLLVVTLLYLRRVAPRPVRPARRSRSATGNPMGS
jgi:uncharacterized membrane protein HdeD (DUF308 family)